MSEFDRALAGLYAAFERPAPKEIFGCYCCLDQEGRDVLLRKPLGVLTSDQLGPYASSVFLTVGDVSDYRYFLPRILDLSASDLAWWPSPEVAVGALTRADWNEWSDVERAAILGFLSAWFDRWAAGLGDGAYGGEVETLLCGMARAQIDIAPYLARLLRSENGAALRELFDLHGARDETSSTPQGFWDEARAGFRQVTAFLASEAARARLSDLQSHPSTNTGPQAT